MSRDVGVGQLVEELEQRGDRLPFEIGAFVALEACEGLIQEAVRLGPDDIRVTVEGRVVVSAGAQPAEPDEAAQSLVSLLARLLIAAGPGVPPYLLELVKGANSGHGPRDLRNLHDAIEASLIPINRGASRRVLARLVRESDRPPAPEADVDPRELDTELEELLRDPELRSLEPMQAAHPMADVQPQEPITEKIRVPASFGRDSKIEGQPETVPVPPSRPAIARSSVPVPELKPMSAQDTAAAAAVLRTEPAQASPEPITATIRKWPSEEQAPSDAETVVERSPAPVPATSSVTATGVEADVGGDAETAVVLQQELETPTEAAFGALAVSHADSVPAASPTRESAASLPPVHDRPSLPAPPPPTPSGGWGVFLLATILGLGLGFGVYALLGTGALDRLTRPDEPTVPADQSGIIDVTVTPNDSQIFIFVGRGPATASDLPVGGAHEFVIFDQGLMPARAAVPEGATWSRAGGGALYELAIQTRAVAEADEADDFGAATTEPASSSSGETGTVRVITNPQGAKVYRYVGVGPNARIPASSIQEGQEVLVYHPGYESRRAVIGPSDWLASRGEGPQSATLSVELPELPKSALPEALED